MWRPDEVANYPTLRVPRQNPALRRFWLTPSRGRVLFGGRASSKSYDAATEVLKRCRKVKLKVMCVRQFQERIAESVYTLLVERIDDLGLADEFIVLKATITHIKTGSTFIFYGMARNVREVKSAQGIDILWIEEGEGLTQEQFIILEPTLRKQGSEIWLIFNPYDITDFSYRNFVLNTPEGWIKRKINYNENPFLSDTMLDVIAKAKRRDPELFRHIYGGEPRDSSEGAVIRRKYIMAAVGAEKILGLERLGLNKRIGYDVADTGDRCTLVASDGPIVTGLEWWRAEPHELKNSSRRAHRKCRKLGAHLIYDGDGLGAGVGSDVNDYNELILEEFGHTNKRHDPYNQPITFQPFRAGTRDFIDEITAESEWEPGIKVKDFFSNDKAHAWFWTSRRFVNTYLAVETIKKGEATAADFDDDDLIAIDANLPYKEALITELSTPRRLFDVHTRYKVESKQDLAKRQIPSTDLADGFIMSQYPKTVFDGFFA